MDLAPTVLRIVAPVRVLAGIGHGGRRAGYGYPTGFMTRLAMMLAMPCPIFTARAAKADPLWHPAGRAVPVARLVLVAPLVVNVAHPITLLFLLGRRGRRAVSQNAQFAYDP